MKQCSKCKEVKALDCFYKTKSSKGVFYFRGKCKVCIIALSKNWATENLERRKYNQKEYRIKNKDRLTKYRKEYWVENKESLQKKNKNYNKKNSDTIRVRRKAFRQENLDRIRYLSKDWYKKNSSKVKENQRAYTKKLPDAYVAFLLKQNSLILTPETIEIKRELIKLHRLIKEKEA